MDWGDIVKIALTSGISAALVTFGANCFLKKQDYKRDYYKKIVDKRLKAYEELEKVIGKFCVHMEILDLEKKQKSGDGFFVFLCFCEEDKLQKANDWILGVIQNALWYSDDINKSLKTVNEILAEVGTVLNKPTPITVADIEKYNLGQTHINENLIKYIGRELYGQLEDLMKIIGKAVYRDLKNIDEVEEFLKD
ncbi:MAG: hypothetical protein RSB90_10330, partial [Eubacterium sp.]